LDKLAKQLDDAQKALEGLDGQLGSVSFDPNDPASIEAAIKQMESMIDDRIGSSASNLIIGQIIAPMKERYRNGILDRAAAARLKKGDE
jgi:hypothetical protein